MIKFDVKSRFTGEVQFTAKIECEESEARSVKIGMAVRWAVKNRASLDGANLYRANLNGANLDGANLNGANLDGASLNGASLNRASLNGASLNRASLDGASLDGASLDGASLYRASLNGANLYRANLNGASGLNDWVKCIQLDQYPITYTSDVLQIGCQRHPIADWAEFDDRRIAEMDGKDALKFWRKYKDWIFQTIELCPAKPTVE